jgi:hypothetical protein
MVSYRRKVCKRRSRITDTVLSTSLRFGGIKQRVDLSKAFWQFGANAVTSGG